MLEDDQWAKIEKNWKLVSYKLAGEKNIQENAQSWVIWPGDEIYNVSHHARSANSLPCWVTFRNPTHHEVERILKLASRLRFYSIFILHEKKNLLPTLDGRLIFQFAHKFSLGLRMIQVNKSTPNNKAYFRCMLLPLVMLKGSWRFLLVQLPVSLLAPAWQFGGGLLDQRIEGIFLFNTD